MSNYGNEWLPEKVELLTKLWTDGLSYRQIATELGDGHSRNAVIGKVHRMGLPSRERPRRDPTQVKRINKRRDNNPFFVPEFAAEPDAAPKIDDLQIPQAQRITNTLNLKNCHCHWPVGDPGKPDFFYCGDPTADLDNGKPYCAAHQARARVKAFTRREITDEERDRRSAAQRRYHASRKATEGVAA